MIRPTTRTLAALLLLSCCAACSGEAETPQESMPEGEERMNAGLADLTTALDMATADTGDDGPQPDASPPLDLASDPEDAPRDEADMAEDEPDLSPPPPTGVPILVAQGKLGRTLISCDGGVSWTGDRNMAAEGHEYYCGVAQPDARCGETACQQFNKQYTCEMQQSCACSDHQPGSPTGIGYGDGWFFATFGHGAPGSVWRSRDGISWEELDLGDAKKEINTFKAMAHGDGVTVLGHPHFAWSDDGGETWQRKVSGGGDLSWMSGMHYSPTRKMFIAFGRTGTARSFDRGKTWHAADDIPQECVGNFGSVVQHGDTILLSREARGEEPGASLCISRDGGETFAAAKDFSAWASKGAAHDGALFHLWNGGKHFWSADAVTWEQAELKDEPRQYKALTYDPAHGHFVTTSRHDYDRQVFAYSVDGTTWTSLTPGKDFPPGPSIRGITFGYAPEGFECPSR